MAAHFERQADRMEPRRPLTQQISDRIRFSQADYFLLGVSGTGLFDPAQHGLAVRWISTACYRGFHCGYEVLADGRLVLQEVYLGLAEQQAIAGVQLFGRSTATYPMHVKGWTMDGASVDEVRQSHDHRLTDLREPIAFDGSVLIATGSRTDVQELTFRAGRLASVETGGPSVDHVLSGRAPDPAAPRPSQDVVAAWRDRLARYGIAARDRTPQSRTTCRVDLEAGIGLRDGLTPFTVYVDGNVHGPRPSERAPGRQILHLEPGRHRLVLRGRRVDDPQRIESNTVHFDVEADAPLRLNVAMTDGRLTLSQPVPAAP